MLPTQIWIVMKQSTNLELNEPIMEWNECEMLVRRRRSNPSGHTDGLVVFACSSDASDGQSS